ncbi:hypothetical protein CPHO_04450 [Corynebacterium phocae]|uniref:HTH tetR-type domain-containing protein n=1 Tax=Corynebacterium phocae TaxID=161895 RepID=A0A1L7D2G1_9CORY|nr:TetR family transcriptional regulator [Corynebacterium phocae]APT92263.1 hypothetical protein CPHO_04450 [Corynebacterium phocae]KAA8725411.1 TetR family transcriptional regulator [Corynebacterium phocae]
MHLNRELIISTALDILDEYGLGDTTMRRIAGNLGVAPGALYWHISNKQALIAALADKIIYPVSGDTPHELALSLRECLLAHRDGAEVVTAGLSQPGNHTWEQLVTTFAGPLTELGIPAPSAAVGARAIAHLVLGATTMEQAWHQLQHAQAADAAPAATTASAGAAELKHGVAVIIAGLVATGRGD